MFERLKRFVRSLTAPSDDEPESFDHPRPQRVNPAPPAKDWYARVRDKSLAADRAARARVVADVKALDALDEDEPALSQAAWEQVDDLLTRAGAPVQPAQPSGMRQR